MQNEKWWHFASARLVETDVTTVLEEALSGIESVKALTLASREEVSLLTLEFELSRDLDDAANDVQDRVCGSCRGYSRALMNRDSDRRLRQSISGAWTGGQRGGDRSVRGFGRFS
jgi:hypothetical protein